MKAYLLLLVLWVAGAQAGDCEVKYKEEKNWPAIARVAGLTPAFMFTPEGMSSKKVQEYITADKSLPDPAAEDYIQKRAAVEAALKPIHESFQAEKGWVLVKCKNLLGSFGTPANEVLNRQFHREYLTRMWLECTGLEDFVSSWIENPTLTHCQVFGQLVDLRARVDAAAQFPPSAERKVASDPKKTP